MNTSDTVIDRRAVLHRRVRLLVAATITYNVIEAIVAITAGTIADSVALIGFGLDSVIEVSSAAAVAWQFAGRHPEQRERVALRVIAWSFFALAAYVTVEALRALFGAAEAEQSTVGIVLVALSVVVMPVLSLAQRRAGRELGSASAVADSKQTLLCTYLSAAVLVGLVLNAALGWWWADPAAALVLAILAVREGRNALRGETCCAPTYRSAGPDQTDTHNHADDTCGCSPGYTAPQLRHPGRCGACPPVPCGPLER
jgi:divalent metal cation (Fe/Co/Zn/Cd) transporter